MISLLSKLLRGRDAVAADAPVTVKGTKGASHSLCYAPSVNMLFATNGNVKACCHNSENSLGKYPEQSISEIWNSKEALAFRQQLDEQKFLSGCHVCAVEYDTGHPEEMPATHFERLPRNASYPSMMEFLLSNQCNLECVMCTGYLSSSIRKNRDKLPPIESPYDDQFVEQLREFIPHLTEARFSGAGEAFSIPINYKIWEMIIELNPACTITIQTNGTMLNARIKDFLQRGNFKIGVSLDSLHQGTFEAIRLNASFDRVMESIQYFTEYNRERNKVFNISTCVMRSNWKELPDFVALCNSIGAHIVFHKVWSPPKYALYNLPPSDLIAIHTELKSHICPSDTPVQRKNKKHYEYFVSVIERWMIDAPNREKDEGHIKHLSIDEMLEYVNDKLETHINHHSVLEPDKEELIRLCRSKIETVTAMWQDEPAKRKMLIRLCTSKDSDILAYVKNQPVEKLYEMSVTTTDI